MRHIWLRPSIIRDKMIPQRLLTGEKDIQKHMCFCKYYVPIISQEHSDILVTCWGKIIIISPVSDVMQWSCLSFLLTQTREHMEQSLFNHLNPELNPICYLLALLGAHHFLHVSRISVKLLTFMLLMSYIYGAPILDVSRSHTTTQHSR